MKKIGLVAVMLLVLASFTIPSTTADPSDRYDIRDIYVEDINADVGSISVDRGERIEVEVFFTTGALFTDDEEDDVEIEVWIDGYDEDIEDEIRGLEIDKGDFYKETLYLEIPNDIKLIDGRDYTLNVRISDSEGSTSEEVDINVKELEHSLEIKDVIFNPRTVQPGAQLRAEVRVENLGDEEEDDIKVTLELPELGLSSSSYINSLVSELQEEESDDSDDQNSASKSLGLNIPRNVRSGAYEALVTLEYDRGREEVTESYTVFIGSGVTGGEAQVSVQDSTLNAEAGDTVVYTVMVRNLGESTSTFSFDVPSFSWGTAEVEPSDLVLRSDEAGEVFVFVTPHGDVAGMKTLSLVVSEGNSQVDTLSLRANVDSNSVSSDSFRRGLEIGFAVLLVILVILGIVLAVRRVGKSNDIEEPVIEEDQTYY